VLAPVVTRCVFRSQFDQKIAMLDPAGELTAPPDPLAELRARKRRGEGREEGRG